MESPGQHRGRWVLAGDSLSIPCFPLERIRARASNHVDDYFIFLAAHGHPMRSKETGQLHREGSHASARPLIKAYLELRNCLSCGFDLARNIRAEDYSLRDDGHAHRLVVRGMDRDGVDPDQHLILSGDRFVHLAQRQGVGETALLIDAACIGYFPST